MQSFFTTDEQYVVSLKPDKIKIRTACFTINRM